MNPSEPLSILKGVRRQAALAFAAGPESHILFLDARVEQADVRAVRVGGIDLPVIATDATDDRVWLADQRLPHTMPIGTPVILLG